MDSDHTRIRVEALNILKRNTAFRRTQAAVAPWYNHGFQIELRLQNKRVAFGLEREEYESPEWTTILDQRLADKLATL
jgi:hypothetical protein